MATSKRAAVARKAPAKKADPEKPAQKKRAPKKRIPAKKLRTPAITLATLSAQIEALAGHVAKIEALLHEPGHLRAVPLAPASTPDRPSSQKPITEGDFELELLVAIRALGQRGGHDGLVPIAALREVFLGGGWSRDAFDKRLLEAERDFVVDLKSGPAPARPDLAIEAAGRAPLHYVVAR